MPGIGFTQVTILELDDLDVAAQAGRVVAVDDELRATGRMHPAHAAIAADMFVAHGRGYGLFLGRTDAVLVLNRRSAGSPIPGRLVCSRPSVLRLKVASSRGEPPHGLTTIAS